jgi:excinuclease ABC subunit B
MQSIFKLKAPYKPTGDQPQAIKLLSEGLSRNMQFQTLEGVTGSGKTFTIANVIASHSKPTLVISHNKTLAAQLFAEFKELFPDNAVEYFISYYDYYQPEAYIPQTDTYIAKDASINEEIERLRLSATNSLLNREDVIIVASVSCIYGLGSPEDYKSMLVMLKEGLNLDRDIVIRRLVDIQYTRNDYENTPGTFRVRGDTLDIFPSYARYGIRVTFLGEMIESIWQFDPLTGHPTQSFKELAISPAKHFVLPAGRVDAALVRIKTELEEKLRELTGENKLLEAERLKQRTEYDMEMLKEIGYCSGIENYSRHLSGRQAGEPPATLLDYMPEGFLTIVDESHVTLPQVRGMYNGDQARKEVLVQHGFRLPSAKDNRPLNFKEFLDRTSNIIFMSATPDEYELKVSQQVVRQIIRPTGLTDPAITISPLKNQIDDIIRRIREKANEKERVLVTTLTKKTAEDLSNYLQEMGLKVTYLHSDLDALERVDVLHSLRTGEFDCLIGINLLREGLDLPEVALVAILDADKEGFLRSETALIQTAGRAARHVKGEVVLYADNITGSMRRALKIMEERRKLQLDYNKKHNITPRGITKSIRDTLVKKKEAYKLEFSPINKIASPADLKILVAELENEMREAAEKLQFERAAMIRDQIAELSSQNKGRNKLLKKPVKTTLSHSGKKSISL